jgi:hypothetical protein
VSRDGLEEQLTLLGMHLVNKETVIELVSRIYKRFPSTYFYCENFITFLSLAN